MSCIAHHLGHSHLHDRAFRVVPSFILSPEILFLPGDCRGFAGGLTCVRGQENQLTHYIDLYSKSLKNNINIFLPGDCRGLWQPGSFAPSLGSSGPLFAKKASPGRMAFPTKTGHNGCSGLGFPRKPDHYTNCLKQ